MPGGGDEFVVVSDLHLGPGPLECFETFYNDNAFVSFLEHLREQANEQQRRCRLVILGDFVDFLRTELVTNPSGEPPDEATALATLDRVIGGHPKVFDALARFLDCGFSLDVVIGNHDAELVRPAVQRRLRVALTGVADGDNGRGGATGTVSFHRWIYHVPGLLYAEHGHQYDDLNCFSTLLEPFTGDGKVLERPIGSYLFTEAERLQASIDPCPDHASRPRQYFALAGRRRPRAALDALGRKASLAAAVVRRSREMSTGARAERRAKYRDGALRAHAEEVGLSADLLLAIDELSAAARTPRRALTQQVLHRLRPGGGTAGPLGRRIEYLETASVGVHDALIREGCDVPFYVFGHSHAAQHLPLDFGPGAPQYLNTGTWSSILAVNDPVRTIHPTFLQVVPSHDGSPAVARLLAWNNANRAAETLRTHA